MVDRRGNANQLHSSLRSVEEEVDPLSFQWAQIVGECDTYRISPCSASRCQVDLCSARIRYTRYTVIGIKRLPIGDPAIDHISASPAVEFGIVEFAGPKFVANGSWYARSWA